MKLSLVVMTAGKSKGQAIPINLPQFIIGRDPQCNLRPASAVISKRHCALLIKDGKVFVRDFDSTNGTFVNDVPVKGEALLKNDDVLKLGPLEFKVAMVVKPAGSPPTPPLPKPAATPAGHSDDESVAAMLLSLQEDTPNAPGESPLPPEESDIPSGSTVMDLAMKSASAETPTTENAAAAVAVPPEAASAAAAQAGPKKPDPKSDPAHLAAKAILEKYNRRSR